MKENIRFVLILAAVLLALRFGFRLLVRLVQAVYPIVPLYVRVWYITVPLTLLIIFLIRNKMAGRKKKRRFDGLDPADEIHADAEVSSDDADSPEEGADDEC